MTTIDFNVHRITKIKLVEEWLCDGIRYEPSKPIKRFFGLLPPNKFTKAGFIDYSSCADYVYTEEDLQRFGYKVYSEADQIKLNLKGRVFNRAFVQITLDSKDNITKYFGSNMEAKEYVEYLKDTSGITYSTISF